MVFSILILSAFVPRVLCSLVNRMDHDLLIANNSNFDSLVISPRAKTPTSAFFYSAKDKNIKKLINYTMDIVAKDLKGVYPIYTVDCDQPANTAICKRQLNNANTPQLIVYPVLPQPQYFFKGKLDDKDQIIGTLLSHIPSNVEVIPYGGYPLFMTNMEVVPKVLLVTDKEKPSWIYKALSNSFKNSLIFGFFKSKEHSDIVSKYNIKKFPWLAVIKNNKPHIYNGEMKFQPLFDWLNIYSETYIKGNDIATNQVDITPKPWKFEQIPQLTHESQHDICFRDTSKGLCVIYLTTKLTQADKNMLIDVSNEFSSKIKGR